MSYFVRPYDWRLKLAARLVRRHGSPEVALKAVKAPLAKLHAACAALEGEPLTGSPASPRDRAVMKSGFWGDVQWALLDLRREGRPRVTDTRDGWPRVWSVGYLTHHEEPLSPAELADYSRKRRHLASHYPELRCPSDLDGMHRVRKEDASMVCVSCGRVLVQGFNAVVPEVGP